MSIKKDRLRKLFTLLMDLVCVFSGILLSLVIYHPQPLSLLLPEHEALIAVHLISTAMMSIILGCYNDPINENLAMSMLKIAGSFLVSLAIYLLYFIAFMGRSMPPLLCLSMIAYTLFFCGAFRIVAVAYLGLEVYVTKLRNGSHIKRTIIVGAGDAGKYLVDLLSRDKTKLMQPVAFVDDNPRLEGKKIKGLHVIGPRELIPYAARKYKAEQIIIAIPFVDNTTIRDIFNLCCQANCVVKRFGNMTTFTADGLSKATINEIRLEDLLGRDVVRLDLKSVSDYIKDRTVLVTGGAGSIGLELCRQILHYNAKLVVIFDFNENMLFEAKAELEQKFPSANFITCLGSIQDRSRLQEVFELHRPQVVFHAAAHKHVPMMEMNPREAIKNNILGTLYTVETAVEYKVNRFILISTDKAVNPTNIMGATKRVAEMIVQRANTWGSTQFAAVRFGNVLGSNGSVVPIFKKQILAGGPLTVTDKEIKRYFMTIPEAVQLVLEAGSITKGGEVFVLDMGQPIRIYDLATSMIRLSGLQPDKDIKIVLTGLRPGEKLFEEISLKEETVSKTDNERIFVLKPARIYAATEDANFGKLRESIDNSDYASALNEIKELVPTFDSNPDAKNRG